MLEGQFRNPSGCAISAIFDKSGKRFGGDAIVRSISVMHDRSNGLGGGFAGYGIYPEYKDYFAFHIFYDSSQAKRECEEYLENRYDIVNLSKIPTRKIKEITDEPLIMRYFVTPLKTKLDSVQLSEDEYVARSVFFINTHIKGAYIFSSGKNMGIFKAVGYPEDVGRFYMLENYEGYCFNTPGWWGGAHPFGLLELSVVHNGEISSYDANRSAMETYGYKCTLLTDTEVITYILDYLTRKKGLTYEEAASVMAAPFWQTIERADESERERLTYLRHIFASQLITGPFSILVGFNGGIMALNDRLKLRSLVVAEKGERVYIASEESAIRVIEPSPEKIRYPKGGEPVIYTLEARQ